MDWSTRPKIKGARRVDMLVERIVDRLGGMKWQRGKPPLTPDPLMMSLNRLEGRPILDGGR